MRIKPKDLDIALREICFDETEYIESKIKINRFLKTGDMNKLSLKLRG